MIVGQCGKCLTDLTIYAPSLDGPANSVTNLAELTGQLQSLHLISMNCLYLHPYPPTLRRLTLEDVSVAMATLVLSVLQTHAALPHLEYLCVKLYEEEMTAEDGGAIAIMAELAAECAQRGVVFSCQASQ